MQNRNMSAAANVNVGGGSGQWRERERGAIHTTAGGEPVLFNVPAPIPNTMQWGLGMSTERGIDWEEKLRDSP